MHEILECPANDRGAPALDDETGAPDLGFAFELLLRDGQDGPAPEVALLSDQDAFRFERPASAREPHRVDEPPQAWPANVIPFRPRAASATREIGR